MKDGKLFDPEKLSVKAGAFELVGVQLVSMHAALSSLVRSADIVATIWVI